MTRQATTNMRGIVELPQLPRIRRAGADDAEKLSRLSIRTFVDAFGHLYPTQDLQAFLGAVFAVGRQRELLVDSSQEVWLLERDDEALGYVAVGACGLPHPQVGPGDGELKRLYLLRPWQSGGWGTRLMQVALDRLLRDGPRVLWVGVWSGNHGAQRFYLRHGFVPAGSYEFPVGTVRDHELILRREKHSAI